MSGWEGAVVPAMGAPSPFCPSGWRSPLPSAAGPGGSSFTNLPMGSRDCVRRDDRRAASCVFDKDSSATSAAEALRASPRARGRVVAARGLPMLAPSVAPCTTVCSSGACVPSPAVSAAAVVLISPAWASALSSLGNSWRRRGSGCEVPVDDESVVLGESLSVLADVHAFSPPSAVAAGFVIVSVAMSHCTGWFARRYLSTLRTYRPCWASARGPVPATRYFSSPGRVRLSRISSAISFPAKCYVDADADAHQSSSLRCCGGRVCCEGGCSCGYCCRGAR